MRKETNNKSPSFASGIIESVFVTDPDKSKEEDRLIGPGNCEPECRKDPLLGYPAGTTVQDVLDAFLAELWEDLGDKPDPEGRETA